MNTFKIRNSIFAGPLMYVLYAFFELFAYNSLPATNIYNFGLRFTSFALFQGIVYYLANLHHYQSQQLNMYLSYGFTRKDIVMETLKSMLNYFIFHNLVQLLFISLEFGIQKGMLIMLAKFVHYVLFTPLVLYLLFKNNPLVVLLGVALAFILSPYVPVIIIDLLFAIILSLRLKKIIFKDNLV